LQKNINRQNTDTLYEDETLNLDQQSKGLALEITSFISSDDSMIKNSVQKKQKKELITINIPSPESQVVVKEKRTSNIPADSEFIDASEIYEEKVSLSQNA
jgi:predicted enzyme involved in methoxymalonyl-ACP biosynthesis